MAVPHRLLRLAEDHECFSGCFAPGNYFECLVDPNGPPEQGFDVQCQDCLNFRIAGLVSTLGAGATPNTLARELSAHVQATRGYTLAFGGYHPQAGGFWLSAAYWSQIGVFILKSDRGRGLYSGRSDVDLLTIAFNTGAANAPDPAMHDPNQYVSHRIFLDATILPPLLDVQALLASTAVSLTPRSGFVEVTLAEFLPVSRNLSAVTPPAALLSPQYGTPAPASQSTGSHGAAPHSSPQSPLQLPAASSSSSSNSSSTGGGLQPSRRRRVAAPAVRAHSVPKVGDRCELCGELFEEKPLLTSVYIGCGCK